jgi:hypothetical protein
MIKHIIIVNNGDNFNLNVEGVVGCTASDGLTIVVLLYSSSVEEKIYYIGTKSVLLWIAVVLFPLHLLM